MLWKLLFPGMPKFLSDILVLAELGVTITQFILALISISCGNNRAFNITYIVVASLAVLLAMIDGLIYFIELGSCARIFRYCYSKQKHQQNSVDKKKCHLLPQKVKKWLAQSFELVRTLLSELLIYPLVVLDLFDLIVSRTYLQMTSADRINFSLFIIGSTFFVLSVYFTRTFLVISAAINIQCTPLDPSKSKSNMIRLVTHFCIHVIFQIVVHITIFAIVGITIFQENPVPSDTIYVSPCLAYIILVGGILPIYGIGIFFIINYYNLREVSMGFGVNMLALLQSESFATTVFSNTGVKESKERAKRIIKKIKYEEVKHQFKKFQSAPRWIKLLYPFRFPFLFAIAAFYEILLFFFFLSLICSLIFGVQQPQFIPVFFVIASIIIVLANIHVIILVTTWILAALTFIILLVIQPVIVVIASLLYVPICGCIMLYDRKFQKQI